MTRGMIVAIGLLVALAIGGGFLLRGRAPAGDAVSGTRGEMTAGGNPARGAESAGAPAPTARGEVSIDPRRQQLIGVRIAPVRRSSVSSEIRATGVVRYDERRQAEITTRVDGWIRDLHVNYTGAPITRGQLLFTLYSPELVAAQNEYLLALRGRAQAAGAQVGSVLDYSERLVQAARERLLRWDLSEQDLQQLEQRRRAAETIPFRAPAAGIVVEKMAVQGMRVMAGQTLYRLADLSVVWVEADVYEQDLAQIRIGQSATVTLDAYPGEPFVGRATYIYPTVAEQTRTAKVRFEFANRGGRLKPGMYATVQLAGRAASALTIPADALLDTGSEQLVFVARGEGYFEPRPVKAGRRTEDGVEVLEGLKEGEQVASGATFFLDSESQLRAAVQSYAAPQDAAAASTAPAERLDITFRPQVELPRTGENMFEVMVKTAEGQPIADADVTVTFFMPAMPTMNMPAMRNQAKLPSAGGGVYRGTGQVMMAGRWDVTVDVSRGGQRLGSRQFAVVAR